MVSESSQKAGFLVHSSTVVFTFFLEFELWVAIWRHLLFGYKVISQMTTCYTGQLEQVMPCVKGLTFAFISSLEHFIILFEHKSMCMARGADLAFI